MPKYNINETEAESFFRAIERGKRLHRGEARVVYLGYAERQNILSCPVLFHKHCAGYDPLGGLDNDEFTICGLSVVFVYRKTYLAVGV